MDRTHHRSSNLGRSSSLGTFVASAMALAVGLACFLDPVSARAQSQVVEFTAPVVASPSGAAQAQFLQQLAIQRQWWIYQAAAAAAGVTLDETSGPPAPAPNYFTDGAAATSVPTEGPAAAYFVNGAALLTVPSSTIP